MLARNVRRALALIAVAALPSLGAPGCAQQRAPINRVQPDGLDKADLIPLEYAALTSGQSPATLSEDLIAREPVFYTQTTMIAKPTTTGFVGLTSYSEPDKIRWEVTEHYLLARRSFQFVRNAPGGAAGIGQNPRAATDVVAVFAISSHYDARYDYNPATGEELNVVTENTTDRPWFQRRYMRVDWSQNLVDGYNSVFEGDNWDGRIASEPLPVFVNTPNDPNAPVFAYTPPGLPRQLQYFDVVNRALLHPERVDFGDGYQIPICALGEGETDCTASEVTFRMSFRRVDPTRDYEPASLSLPLPGQTNPPHHLDQDRFGFFDQVRLGYDPQQHATLDTQRVHLAARHNLWLHHHALSFGPDLAAQGCNADAECTGGAVCHIRNAAHDAHHRGLCAPLAVTHVPGAGEAACATDDDCRTGAHALSATAVCDAGTRTCGEHYFRCTADADCASVDAQSACDLTLGTLRADHRGLCLMPFRQRQVRPIAYHESPNYPAYMQDVTDSVAREWNHAFEGAVQAARQRECEIDRHVDGAAVDPAANPCTHADVVGTDPALGADGRFVFVGCHATVWGTDPALPGSHPRAEVDAAHAAGWDLAACGPQGTIARLGDLRYNMIGAITDHDAQGYWGLANVASDPETGEMIAGRGAVWQTVTDGYASYLVELVRVLNGAALPTDVADGNYLVQSAAQMMSRATPSRGVLDEPLRAPGALGDLAAAGRATLDRQRLAGAGWFVPHAGMTLHSTDPDHPGALDLAARRVADGRLLGDGTNRGAARRAALQGSELEGMMMNPQQARLAPSARPDPASTLPATLNAASPFRGQSAARRHVIERLRAQLAAWQCNYDASFDDNVILGLAHRLAMGDPILRSNPLDAPVAFGRDWTFRHGTAVDYDLMRQYAAQFIHHGVLAHEIGHSLGMRHNFTASADAVNYNDQFWKVRGLGHRLGLRPRYDYVNDAMDGNFYSPQEIDGRVEEWSYSSVMDYKGFNEDAHGIGRYDEAFVRNGYVNLVEAFRHVADHDGAVTYAINTAGNGESTPLDLRQWQTGGAPHGMHYTQLPDIIGRRADGTPDLGDSNRYNVFLRETQSADVPGFGTPAFTNVTRDGHVLVPYRFDSDERAGLVWQDQRYDAGADAYESLHYVTSHYLDYYFANNFARYRSGFSTEAYVERMWGRYLEQLRQCTQTLAFDLITFQDFLAGSPGYATWRDSPADRGGFVNQAAMGLAADTLVAQLTMPEMGLHRNLVQSDNTQMVVPDPNSNRSFPVAINDGRAFESDWRGDVGFWWYEQLNRAGAYYDKTMSLDALTDPELLLLQRDTPTDLRLFQLSFYTMYPDQMIRLFGGLLAEDHADFAPLIEVDGDHLIHRTHVPTLSLPAGAGPGHNGRVLDGALVPIDPQDHFTLQLWSAVMTVAQFPATFDQRFMDFARVWVDGSVEAITVDDPDHTTVSFVNPFSHETFRALHMGTGAGEPGATVGASAYVHAATGAAAAEAGVGARMILHLRDLDALRLQAARGTDAARTAALESEERQYIDLVHVMRRLTSAFGAGHITTH